ncbi:MAG: phenylacetaldoxime dehydratase family protein [Pseudomonadota bacterium]
MQRSQPETYEAPYPAFQQYQEPSRPDYVMAMIGIQSAPGANGETLRDAMFALCQAHGDGAPAHTEAATHEDAQGARNHVLMPYFHTQNDMAAFFARADVAEALMQPLSGDIGLWAEQLAAPTTALDANNARPDVAYGIARYSTAREEQYHAYMGSMRDRVPDYLAGKANGAPAQLAAQPAPQSKGQVLAISALPHNLCFIRGAFAWKDADPAEQAAFMEQMMPVYREGAHYLRDNPIESGCISMRMADSVQLEGDNRLQSEILGWFLRLEDLERWTRSHPRHLAIMKTIYRYMGDFNFKPKLHLGHEVVVIPQGQAKMLYNNCHPQTGFLPFFPAHVLTA